MNLLNSSIWGLSSDIIDKKDSNKSKNNDHDDDNDENVTARMLFDEMEGNKISKQLEAQKWFK